MPQLLALQLHATAACCSCMPQLLALQLHATAAAGLIPPRAAQIYAAVFEGKMGYRNDSTAGVAKGDAPETIYMV